MAPVEGPHGRGAHRQPPRHAPPRAGHGAAYGSARDQRTSRPAAKEGVLQDFLADKRRVEVLVAGLAFFLYWNTMRAGFVYDDSRAVLRNPDVLGTSPWSALLFNDFWGTPMSHSGSHGSYRPVTVLSLRLDALLARNVLGRGVSPVGFHLVNMALHAVASLLVLRLGRRLLGRWAAAVAGVLFAVHPVHCEAVAGLVGRADLLCAVFFLRAVHDYVRYVDWRETHRCTHTNAARKLAESPAYVPSTDLVNKMLDHVLHEPQSKGRPGRRRAADACAACGVRTVVLLGSSVGLTVVATLSKEVGITALGVCFVYELLVQQRRRQKKMPVEASGLVLLAAVSAALLLARLWVMGLRVPHFAAADNPAAKDPSLLTRTLTFLHLPVVNLGLLLLPQRLSFDWSMEAVPRVVSAADPRNALSAALYLSLWLLCRRTYRRLLRPARAAADALQVADDAGIAPKRAEGVAVALALLVLPALPATNLFFYVGFVVAERVLYVPSVGFCFLVALGAQRLRAPRRDVVEAVLAVAVLVLAARTVARNADWFDEEALYRSGIDVNPPKAYGNLGSVLSAANRLAEAEHAYRMALRHRPNMAEVHYNLGNLLAVMNKYDESARSYEQAIHYRPTLALAYVNLGHILARQGRVQDATEVFRKCVLIPSAGLRDPAGHESARVSALMHLAHIQVGQGRLAQAQRDLDLALRISPAHYETGPILKLMAEVTSGLKANETTAGKAVKKVVLKKKEAALTSSPGTLLNESRCVTPDSRSRVLSHS